MFSQAGSAPTPAVASCGFVTTVWGGACASATTGTAPIRPIVRMWRSIAPREGDHAPVVPRTQRQCRNRLRLAQEPHIGNASLLLRQESFGSDESRGRNARDPGSYHSEG